MASISITALKDLAHRIMSDLGAGYSERIYHNAFRFKLERLDPSTVSEKLIPVVYDGDVLGTCRADLVTDSFVIEVKAARTMPSGVCDQIRKYLIHLHGMDGIKRTGLVINFNQRSEVAEMVEVGPACHLCDDALRVYMRRRHVADECGDS